jgi:hypothetical protein
VPSRVASLNIISPDAEELFLGALAWCADLHRASSLDDLRAVLERRLDGPTPPITLDVIGHSTRDHHLLRLGDTVIDMLNPVVARFFRSIVDDHLLSRLEVVAVRLLGCETAVSPGGKQTLRLLARTLRIPVFGAIKPLMKSHYDKLGFDPAFAKVLVEASELVRGIRPTISAIPARTS